MDNAHYGAARNGSHGRRATAVLSPWRPSGAEIEEASAAIAREIVQAISENVDVNNPECVREALRGLAGIDL